jgi:hypothetical protein
MKENFPIVAALSTVAVLGMAMYAYDRYTKPSTTSKEIQRIEITLKEDGVVQQSENRTYNFNIQVQAGTKLHIDVNNGAAKVKANSVAESNVSNGANGGGANGGGANGDGGGGAYQAGKQLVSDFRGWLDDNGSFILDVIIHWLLGR